MMLTQANLLLLVVLPALAAEPAPFHAPAARSNLDSSLSLFGFGFTPRLARLVKREDVCPLHFNSCAFLDSPQACCQPESICSRDAANNIACCPLGAECTGTLMGTTSTAATSQTPGPAPAPAPTPTSSGFMFPQPGTTAAPTPTGSTVPGAPFPFAYIPTTFHDSAECVRSYSGCQSQFSACTASLGGAYGVTINGGNGAGVTVQGAAPTGNGQAICSSLLLRACFGLQEGYCTAFANGGGTPNGSPQPPHRQSALYEILMGLSIAIAGMIA
ncbi:hypothetical protein GTR04_4748 [Trichophyton interdigitale]|uniref:Hydrophobin n=1 Tax=Trichophyton interdigitale TaxID=101480 RepID=A0A9P5CUY2_9EURO|nr:hypothetical protein GY631_4470 [Trichophyton interdigitale]KAF3893008.1 hypothetical protein GY632_4423 [Trichophyton interdigitale]KAG8207872.1 hypothetical protein GTR04_4748 [Trichophyton interdigitale]